ncbi:MAG: hypothetical protein AAF990_00165 [Bacteroidota bacterium]
MQWHWLVAATFTPGGAPEFFFMLILGLICDFYLVKLTALSDGRLQKWLLGINITLNVGMLAVVKYLNFFCG